MKNLKYIMLLLLSAFTMSLPSAGWASMYSLEDLIETKKDSWQEIIEYTQENLSLEGTLLTKPNGYIYLKVDKGYINVLYPLLGLEDKGFLKPKASAHIGVLFREEYMFRPNISNEWEEIGQTFHFTLEEISIIKTHSNPDNYQVVLRVQSPELVALREKYGLDTPDYFFYISLAKRYY
jgi:hypothetical protein